MKGDRRRLAAATRDTATGQVKMGEAKHKVVRYVYLLVLLLFQCFSL